MAGITAEDVNSLLEIFEQAEETEIIEVKENLRNDDINPTVPCSSSSIVSVAKTGDTAESSVACPSTLSLSQTLSRITRTDTPSQTIVDSSEVLGIKSLPFPESSTDLDLSQYTEDISVSSEPPPFDDQKLTDVSLRHSRSTSSSSLSEMCENRRSRSCTNQNRKRKHEEEIPDYGGLTFDKLPNYYTALAIPSRVMAGSAARSSSDLLADFMHNVRDPSPERKSCSVYDKLPAYYSSFTNSTRYDDPSLQAFETDFYPDEAEYEERYGRSGDENFELNDLNSVDELPGRESNSVDDCEEEKETDTENDQRCTVYVGRIPRTCTSRELCNLFRQFGDIQHCSVHYREHGDNYGFVTFAFYDGACAAVERAGTIAGCKGFDICFGGRRKFCKADYSDLDGNRVIQEELVPFATSRKSGHDDDFDDLLQIARERLFHR